MESEEENNGRIEVLRQSHKAPILDASLVLASQGVRHWIEFDGQEFSLTLEPVEAPKASEILKEYENENRGYHLKETETPSLDLHLSPLLHLAIPVSAFFWAGSIPWQPWLLKRGAADAHLILEGEWWRCLTATTLHADHEHFLGNMLSGFFVLNLLRRRCGPGTSMVLLTLAAGLTNFAVALISTAGHLSIGFSTVVFSGLGMLAGMETLHLPRNHLGGLRALSPLLAAFFLAVLVGMGERADIKAHFIGFGIGAVFSPLVGLMEKRFSEPPWQIAGAASIIAAYAAVWKLALS